MATKKIFALAPLAAEMVLVPPYIAAAPDKYLATFITDTFRSEILPPATTAQAKLALSIPATVETKVRRPIGLNQVMKLLLHCDGVHPLPPHPQHTTELRLIILTRLSSYYLNQSIPSAYHFVYYPFPLITSTEHQLCVSMPGSLRGFSFGGGLLP